jgi:hypothetical protein
MGVGYGRCPRRTNEPKPLTATPPLTRMLGDSGAERSTSALQPNGRHSCPTDAAVHGDDAAGKVPDTDLVVAGGVHPAGECSAVGPGEDRVREVAVGGSVRRHDPRDLRERTDQVAAVDLAERGPDRIGELADDDATTRSGHAGELRERGIGVGDVAQPERDRDRIEALAWEREREGVAIDPGDADVPPPRALMEHVVREVERDDLVGALPDELDRHVARTRRDVEHTSALGACSGRGHAPPVRVLPERENRVREVVARGDTVEHRLDERCILAVTAGSRQRHTSDHAVGVIRIRTVVAAHPGEATDGRRPTLRRMETPSGADAALAAAVAPRADDTDAPFDLAGLAAEVGASVTLLESVARSGLLLPHHVDADGVARYSAADAEAVLAGLTLLEAGLPLAELLALAGPTDAAVADIAERAVDAFLRFVRDPVLGTTASEAEASERLVTAYERMLPATERLVAHHLRRRLILAALARLTERDEE